MQKLEMDRGNFVHKQISFGEKEWTRVHSGHGDVTRLINLRFFYPFANARNCNRASLQGFYLVVKLTTLGNEFSVVFPSFIL